MPREDILSFATPDILLVKGGSVSMHVYVDGF